MKLVISKIKNEDKIRFVAAIRQLYPSYSLDDSFLMAHNLPFADDNCYIKPVLVESLLGSVAEYSYEEESEPVTEDQELIEAMMWYNDLPAAKRAMVETICKSRMPRA